MSVGADRIRSGDIADAFAFAPDAARAASVDASVREALADSLETLREAFAGVLDIPEAALRDLIGAVRAGPIRPQVFALYTDVVQAIHANDGERATRLFGLLAAPALTAPLEERVVTLSDACLGEGMASRYLRILNDGGSSPLALEPLAGPALRRSQETTSEALQLLRTAAPSFAGEVDALGRQLVLARSQEGTAEFGGASTFYLWGAVFLNADAYTDRLLMAEAIVHEVTHLLLFGMCGGEPLVENSDEERYRSPLRTDPRPMEGIVHATYVTARIAAAMEALAEADDLSDAERRLIDETRKTNAGHFRDTLGIIEQNARFTPVGEQVFVSCVEAFPG